MKEPVGPSQRDRDFARSKLGGAVPQLQAIDFFSLQQRNDCDASRPPSWFLGDVPSQVSADSASEVDRGKGQVCF